MKSWHRVLHKREWWVIFFTLGFFLINYPIIHIVNKDLPVFGYPVFFLYLMIGWFGSIMVISLYVWLAERQGEGDGDPGRDTDVREAGRQSEPRRGRNTAGEA